MRPLPRSRASWAFLALAVLSLLILAGFQHHWLGEVSRAEAERMRGGLEVAGARFAEDFNRELTEVYLHFLPLASVPTHSLVPASTDLLTEWRESASFPPLVRDLLVVTSPQSGGPASLWRLEEARGDWEEVEPTEGMQALLQRVADRSARGRRPLPSSRGAPPMLAPEVPAITLPHFELSGRGRGAPGGTPPSPRASPSGVEDGSPGGPPGDQPARWILLRLDEAAIRDGLLPQLAQRYFPSRGHFDYDLAVVTAQGQRPPIFLSDPSLPPSHFAGADLQVPLFAFLHGGELRQLLRRRLADGDPLADAAEGGETEGGEAEDGEARVEADIGSQGHAPAAVEEYPQDRPARPRWSRRPGRFTGRLISPLLAAQEDAGAWRLLARHRAGSLETALHHSRRRNLLLSAGVLLLLATALGFLLLSSRRAEQLAAQQVEFVAGISHELRTPLAAIRSLGQNLSAGVVKEEAKAREYGQLIEHEEARLARLVEQALTFAGILSGRAVYRQEAVDLAQVARDAIRELAPMAAVHGARVELEEDGPAPSSPGARTSPGARSTVITGDPAALGQAVRNLIANAIKYGGRDAGNGDNGKDGAGDDGAAKGRVSRRLDGEERAGASIRVRVQGAHGGEREAVSLSVTDHGRGIARSEIPHLFEPFFRGRDARDAQTAGSGLGLALVRHVAEAHGGRATVESEPGRGSTFTLSFHRPAAAAPAAAAEASSVGPTEPSGPEPRAEDYAP